MEQMIRSITAKDIDYSGFSNGHLRERIKELDLLILQDKRHLMYITEARNFLSEELAKREHVGE